MFWGGNYDISLSRGLNRRKSPADRMEKVKTMNKYRLVDQIAGIAATFCLSILPLAAQAQNTPPSAHPSLSQSAPTQQPEKKGGALAGLNLTDDQKARIKQIHQDTKAKIDAVNNDSTLTADQKVAKSKQLRRAAHRQVRKVLTPEQRQAMRERAKARKQATTPQPS